MGNSIDISHKPVAKDNGNVEKALKESELRFRNILENVEKVAIQGYDEQRRVIYWNKASEILYGYSLQQALGKKLEDLIIPDYMRQEVIEHVTNWIQYGIPIPAGELNLRHQDGSIVPVYSSHVMQEDAQGRKAMYCVDVDLSEIKKVHSQLVEAKEKSDAANKAKSIFLGNMSHELRTPLNGILGMQQLLLTTNLDEEQHEYVLISIESTQHLTNLLSDILDLSRVEADKMDLANEPFDIREALYSVYQVFTLSCQQKGLELQVRTDDRINDIFYGDSSRLQQILNNLVGNAVKFTSSGRICLEAYLLSVFENGKYNILFTVSDTGVGIEDDQVNFIFESFTQADSSYTRKHQGAGLGLSIVKKLVKLMGGNMAVFSEKEKGTIFYICLPFVAV